jgi:hypothetical protein
VQLFILQQYASLKNSEKLGCFSYTQTFVSLLISRFAKLNLASLENPKKQTKFIESQMFVFFIVIKVMNGVA